MQKKTETQQVYAERVNTVIEYINTNLQDKLDVKHLAEISHFSPYHFHRIIRVFLGESLGAYISRTRVETAAKLIRYSKHSMEEIAYNVGFEMPSSFSKAFKKHFTVSPTYYRAHNTYKKIVLSKPTYRMNLPEPQIIERLDVTAIYIRLIGVYGSHDYASTSKKLWAYIGKHQLFGPQLETIGISHDDPGVTEGDKCRYDACVVVDKPVKPEGEIGVKTIVGGTFAVFIHKGSYMKMQETFDAIFSKWIFEKSIELRNAPIMEKYLNNPYETPEDDLRTEIYIPI